MSYYRAALAAARAGKLATATRLVQCSLILREDAPSAARLYELLMGNAAVGDKTLVRLRTLVKKCKYKKALRVRLPNTTKAHTIRGLLFAELGLRFAAREEFALALALDTENNLARRALLYSRSADRKGIGSRE